MTYEETLEALDKIQIDENLTAEDFVSVVECLRMCKIAIKKQIPKKPIPDTKYYGNGKCPNCNAVFLDKSTHYCGNCGQRLDWG